MNETNKRKIEIVSCVVRLEKSDVTKIINARMVEVTHDGTNYIIEVLPFASEIPYKFISKEFPTNLMKTQQNQIILYRGYMNISIESNIVKVKSLEIEGNHDYTYKTQFSIRAHGYSYISDNYSEVNISKNEICIYTDETKHTFVINDPQFNYRDIDMSYMAPEGLVLEFDSHNIPKGIHIFNNKESIDECSNRLVLSDVSLYYGDMSGEHILRESNLLVVIDVDNMEKWTRLEMDHETKKIFVEHTANKYHKRVIIGSYD